MKPRKIENVFVADVQSDARRVDKHRCLGDRTLHILFRFGDLQWENIVLGRLRRGAAGKKLSGNVLGESLFAPSDKVFRSGDVAVDESHLARLVSPGEKRG